MSYEVVWDGTTRTSRYLAVEADPTREAPALPRTAAHRNRAEAVRQMLAMRGPLPMREILAMASRVEHDTLRRTVYLLAQRGHLVVTTQPRRPGLYERVYALPEAR